MLSSSKIGPQAQAAQAPVAHRASTLARAGTGEICFRRFDPALGEFALCPLDLATHAPLIHDWVNREYARYWMMQGTTLEQVVEKYRAILEEADVFLGFRAGDPAFLMESYAPAHSPLAEHYPAQISDRGMHVLVAPAVQPLPGFSWAVFRTIMDFLFSDIATQRVVVEPDVRNDKIHALNRRAGFRYDRVLDLPHKRAYLALCTREDYRKALEAQGADS